MTEEHEPLGEQLAELYQAAIEAERHLILRVGRVSLGLVVLGVGLALIPLPGPGLAVIAGGLVLMSRDVPFARRWLERVRDRLPEDPGGGVAVRVIVVSVMGALISVGVSLWWTFRR